MKTRIALPFLALALLLAGCASQSTSKDAPPGPHGGKSHFASLGTNRVHYVTVGHGPRVVVFVHGWSCNEGFWREQVPALAGQARLILIDLPGHGQSDKPHLDYTIDYFASAVLAVLRDAHVEQAVLVGHSMGTPVICRVYEKAPQSVAALVAVDGLLRRPKIDPAQAEGFIGAYRRPEYRDALKRFVGAMFPNPGTEALRDQVLAEMGNTPQYVMSSAMDSMFDGKQPTWDLPAKVNVPVLVINTQSPMWNDDYKQYVRSLSDRTDYRTIDGAGHFLMLEKPAEFNAALLEELQEFALVPK
jgi:pimeloyl-ACP methyl ester carboxylesterase